MAFVNRELNEEEQREYKLKEEVRRYKNRNFVAKFDGGTIDDENNIRMFIYGDANDLNYWDFEDKPIENFFKHFGVLDFKGEVIYFTAIIERNNNDIKWIVKEFLCQDSRKKSALIDAFKVYKVEGFDKWTMLEEKASPEWMSPNKKINKVEVLFDI